MREQVVDTEKRFFERQLVLFSIGKEFFGVDISDVKEIIKYEEVTTIPNTEEYVEGIINIRGQIVVIIDFAKKIGLTSSEKQSNTRVIITNIKGNMVGFVVDGCNEVLRLTGDKIEEAPSIITNRINSAYIQGVGMLDDRMIIIVDLGRIIQEEELSKLNTISNEEDGSPKKKIMIVEDSSMMMGTLKSYIDQSKFRIIEAKDGEEALTRFKSETPDIILLDIKLPKLSGIDVLKKIKEENPDIPVIMETSVYDEKTKEECMKIGAFDYLKKPINKKDIEDLLEKIK